MKNDSKNKLISEQPKPERHMRVHAWIRSVKNQREYMEDFVAIKADEKLGVWIGAVFDGHGGREIAQAAAKEIPEKILRVMRDYPLEDAKWPQYWKNTVIKWDNKQKKSNTDSGSTMTMLVRTESKCWTINLGDSRISTRSILFKKISETKDHKINMDPYITNAHIRRCGCTIEKKTGYVVKNTKDTTYRLAMTRSLGDYVHKPCISSEPTVMELPQCMDAFLASDGLWDAFEPSEIWQLIDAKSSDTPKKTLSQLEKRAINEGSTDNISMIYVRFFDN